MLKNPTVWFVIADGARARILRYTKDDGGFEQVKDMVSAAAHRSSRDLGSDRPGRAFESVGGARHAIEGKSDLHDKSEMEFAQIIAGDINEGADRGDFQFFALIAQPRFIRAIKSSLKQKANATLFAELPKDLTRLPELDLRERLMSLPIPHRTG